MKGPKLWALLAASAVAVGFQNYVFFSQQATMPPAPDDEYDSATDFDEDSDGDESTASGERLPPIDRPTLSRWLASIGAESRNPFLTRSEFERNGGTPTRGTRVAGVLISTHRRVAWIDGVPHSEGDWVGDVRIERIEPDGVALRRGDQIDHLPLSPRSAFDTSASDGASHEEAFDE